MERHWATIFESISDAIPDRPALTNGTVTRTWREYDDRAARFAAALVRAGLGPDSKVALYLYNGNEYLEAQYGAFKMRGVPVNVNYRYLDDELWYLLDNADAEALVFHSSLSERVGRVAGRLPKLKLLTEVDDGGPSLGTAAAPWEQLLHGHHPMERIARSEDDVYMLYTGGTTGMPKGVMYQMANFVQHFMRRELASLDLPESEDPADLAPIAATLHARGTAPVTTTAAPLMHGTGLWLGVMMHQLVGAHVVTLTKRRFDAADLLRVIEQHRCTHVAIVGDAFAKPIIRALDEADEHGRPFDTSSLRRMYSSGTMWTAEVKQALLDRMPQLVMYDSMGASEGSVGAQITSRSSPPATARFELPPTSKVFRDDFTEVVPGSDEVGMVAIGAGMVPTGYYKDPEKSARTFPIIDGVRYSMPGDLAQVAADGTLILLGRGSQVINSGGEKIYPEEVEEAVKRVEGVVDCLVVGIDDERFGQAVTAVAALAPHATPTEAQVIAAVKEQLASYKAPKHVVFVDEIPRAPNGKADYKAAKRLATGA